MFIILRYLFLHVKDTPKSLQCGFPFIQTVKDCEANCHYLKHLPSFIQLYLSTSTEQNIMIFGYQLVQYKQIIGYTFPKLGSSF